MKRLTDNEINDPARHMLTEVVVRHVQPETDDWNYILARRCPEASLIDREYIKMRAAVLIEEWRRGR